MKLNYNAFVRMEFMDDFHLDHEVFEIQIVKDIGGDPFPTGAHQITVESATCAGQEVSSRLCEPISQVW